MTINENIIVYIVGTEICRARTEECIGLKFSTDR